MSNTFSVILTLRAFNLWVNSQANVYMKSISVAHIFVWLELDQSCFCINSLYPKENRPSSHSDHVTGGDHHMVTGGLLLEVVVSLCRCVQRSCHDTDDSSCRITNSNLNRIHHCYHNRVHRRNNSPVKYAKKNIHVIQVIWIYWFLFLFLFVCV